MFKLVIEDDEGNKTVVPVIRDEISIGRQEGNTIRLTERNVSRRHAKLIRGSDSTITVEELSARYGTRKNGEKISGTVDFAIGDVFLIGDYRLTVQGDTPPEAKVEPKTNGIPAPPALPKPSKGGFSSQPTQITRTEDLERRASAGTELIPAAPAKIVVVSSNFAGQEFPLSNKEMMIGRGDECDIIVDHRSVSQSHAKIVRETSGTYKIVDLNSKNGIKVSGEEYKAVHLKRGDVIELGHVKFRFVEPNENYVFTPQSILPDDEDVVVETGPNKNLLMGGFVLLVLAGLGVGLYAVMEMTSSSPDPDAIAAAVEQPGSSSVEPQLAKAEEELQIGNADRAIAILELARDTMSPNSEEKAKIGDMLSQARREKPLEEALKESRASYKDRRYVDALRRLKSIPPDDSIIYGLVQDEELVEKTIEQILAEAQAALQEGDKEDAVDLLEEVLLFDPEHPDALAIKGEATAVAVVAAPVAEKSTKKVKSGSTPKTTKPAPKKAMTEEERDARIARAQDALMAGNWNEILSECQGVRHSMCYRLVGMAHSKLGDQPKACEFFKRGGVVPPECK